MRRGMGSNEPIPLIIFLIPRRALVAATPPLRLAVPFLRAFALNQWC